VLTPVLSFYQVTQWIPNWQTSHREAWQPNYVLGR